MYPKIFHFFHLGKECNAKKMFNVVKECDAIMQVVRCFGGDKVLRDEPVDPVGDIEVIELELAMADLETVTRNVDRVAKKARTGDKDAIFEQELFERAKAMLEKAEREAIISPMPYYGEQMTVAELIDLVEFLHAQYTKLQPEYYRGYYLTK